jgi:hypothetical protein
MPRTMCHQGQCKHGAVPRLVSHDSWDGTAGDTRSEGGLSSNSEYPWEEDSECRHLVSEGTVQTLLEGPGRPGLAPRRAGSGHVAGLGE